jgi:hypothetical protein
MLVLAALNKCFAAITTIPGKVMSWIGGGGEAEQAPLDSIKGGVEAAGGRAGGAMVSSGQKTEEAMKAKATAERERDKGQAGISAGQPPPPKTPDAK